MQVEFTYTYNCPEPDMDIEDRLMEYLGDQVSGDYCVVRIDASAWDDQNEERISLIAVRHQPTGRAVVPIVLRREGRVLTTCVKLDGEALRAFNPGVDFEAPERVDEGTLVYYHRKVDEFYRNLGYERLPDFD